MQNPHNRPKKGHIVIHGFYGAGNLGDEVVLSAILNQISTLKHVHPVIFSRNPTETREKYQVTSINPYAKCGIAGYLNLLKANVYILGGGGLLKDYGNSSRSIEDWLHWLYVAKSLGLRTMLWSIGVEGLYFDRSKELVKRVLNSVDAIVVRDSNSKKRLTEIGVQNNITVTADPAVLLVSKYVKKRSLKQNPRVVVCPRHWFKYGFFIPDASVNEHLLSSIAMILDYVRSGWNAEIELLPFRTVSYDDDRKIVDNLISRISEKSSITIHNRVPHTEEIVSILSNADIVVGMRLHSIILATSLGVPTLALSYMSKVEDYMNYINQGRFCFDVEKEIEEKRLKKAIEEMMNNYGEISQQLMLASSNLSRKLQLNVEILSQLLS